MFRSFKARASALALAFSCALGVSPAVAQTTTGLSVLDAFKSVQNECQVVSTNGLYHPCTAMEALFGGQPKPLTADAAGDLNVNETNSAAILASVQAAQASGATTATNTTNLLKAGGTVVTGSGSVTTEVNSGGILTAGQTVASAQGASGTGITAPAGGSGLLGWLSGIYKAVTNPQPVTQSGTWTVGLSAGSQVVGAVTQSGGPWSVSCTLAQCAVTTTPAAGSIQAVSQSGSWNMSLLAGSAIVGKFGIDQTTPGTTNGVQTLSGSVTTATISGQPSVQGVDAEAASVTGKPVLTGGKDSTGKAHAAATDFAGSYRPARGVYRTNPFNLAANTAAVIEDSTQQGNRATRMGMYITLGATTTVPVYLCYNGQGTSCSATAFDDIIPPSSAIGAKTIPIFGARAAVSAFATAAVNPVAFTDVQPETN